VQAMWLSPFSTVVAHVCRPNQQDTRFTAFASRS